MPKSPSAAKSSSGLTDLSARYGSREATGKRDKILLVVAALVLLACFVVWLVFFGPFAAKAGLSWDDTGNAKVDDRTAEISWTLTVEPGTETSCALQVQNEAHAIVGWKIIDIPASQERTRSFTEQVRTVQPGVTGLIYRCWLK